MNEKEGTTHVVKVLIPHLESVLHFLFPPPPLLILSILSQSIVCKYTMYLVAVVAVVLAAVVCNCSFR